MGVSTLEVLKTATRLKCLDRINSELRQSSPNRELIGRMATAWTDTTPDLARALIAWAAKSPDAKPAVKVLFFSLPELSQTRLKESRKPRYVQ